MACSHTSTTARIVVGVDGSPESRRALRTAARIAADTGARVHAIATWSGSDSTGRLRPGERPDAVLADTVEAAFEHNAPPDTQLSVLAGQPVSTLIDASRGALTLVVGSHFGWCGDRNPNELDVPAFEGATCPVVVVADAGMEEAATARSGTR
jgi:nucleotide-binding universal stress UspA family protein